MSTRVNIRLADDRSSALLAIAPPIAARAQYSSMPAITISNAMMQFAGVNSPEVSSPTMSNSFNMNMSESGSIDLTVMVPTAKLMTRAIIQLIIWTMPVMVMARSFPSTIAAGLTLIRKLSISFELFSITTLFATPCPYARTKKYNTITIIKLRNMEIIISIESWESPPPSASSDP